MKKMFPVRSYFVRAKLFGFVLILVVVVYLVILVLDLLGFKDYNF